MSILLAALDASAAARPVLDAAVRVAEMTGASVEAVHIGDRTTEMLETLTARAAVPLRVLAGPAESTLLRAIGDPGVSILVMGARATSGGRRPVGSTARHILHHAAKPVVIVPPDVEIPSRFRRVLVPLEGTERSSRPVLERLRPLLKADVELIVLHVFTDVTLPAMLDRPHYDIDILGREFLTRHFPPADGIELRSGPVGTSVAEVSRQRGVDVIALSWSQDSSGERARIVREVLSSTLQPVLLLPADPGE